MKKIFGIFILTSLFDLMQGQTPLIPFESFSHGSSGQFGKDSLQTSDVLEIHKRKKFKPIFFNDKISVHYVLKIVGDTIYYKIITGKFALFKHDTITRRDSLILYPNITQTYFTTDKNKTSSNLSNMTESLPQTLSVYFTSISKIVIGRKTYKFMRTNEKEAIWSLGE
jgi:hypothetical protein